MSGGAQRVSLSALASAQGKTVGTPRARVAAGQERGRRDRDGRERRRSPGRKKR